MSSMGQTDRAAIDAILAGDRDAYGELVKRHSRMLFRLAYRMTGNQADADDVVQDAFLRAYQNLAAFESRSDFGTWIYRIAARCALDRLAKRRVEESRRVSGETDPEQDAVQVPDRKPDPERMVMSAEIAALQELAMRGLTPVERMAFVLRHLEDRSTEEIAEVLNVTPNTAKQSVYRAVQKVRHRLTQLKVMA